MHWQKAPGLEGKQHCKCQLKHWESSCDADKLHRSHGVRAGMSTVALLRSAKGFLRKQQVLTWNFWLGSSNYAWSISSYDSRRIPWDRWSVGQGHQSQVPLQVGRGQMSIWIGLKRRNGLSDAIQTSFLLLLWATTQHHAGPSPRHSPCLCEPQHCHITAHFADKHRTGKDSIRVSQDRPLGQGLLHTKTSPWDTAGNNTQIHSLALVTKFSEELCLLFFINCC